jgi:hypothetical protein
LTAPSTDRTSRKEGIGAESGLAAVTGRRGRAAAWQSAAPRRGGMEAVSELVFLFIEFIVALVRHDRPQSPQPPPDPRWGVAAERASDLWVRGASDAEVLETLTMKRCCTARGESFTERLVERMRADVQRNRPRR